MNNNQIDALLQEIKLKAWDATDDETFKQLTAARKAIREWQKKGSPGAMPYRTKLKEWGIDAEGGSSTTDGNSAPEAEANAAFADVEPELLRACQDAQAMLDNERYHSAKRAFASLLSQTDESTPFGREVAAGYEEAARKLEKAVAPLIDKARQYTRRHPEKLDKQRELWQAVLQVDPDNETTQQALQALETEGSRAQIEAEADRIEKAMREAVEKHDLPAANRLLGAIQSLAEDNTFPDLQPRLDALVAEITEQRDRLREQLGAASTLSVSGDAREGYRYAREHMSGGTPVMVDAAGILGEADVEVATDKLYPVLRQRFLNSLMNLAQQRRQLADEQKKESPGAAKKTLESMLALLDDDILTGEDRDELKDTRQGIENDLALVEARIERHEKARALVLQADEAGKSYEEKLKLYREAREIYPDYRNIDRYIEDTQDALAAQLAGRVRDRMTQIRLDLSRNAFQKALDDVAATREWAIKEAPDPKPGSELAKVMAELEQLNGEIVAANGRYADMMRVLADVDRLLDEYAETQAPELLNEARLQLDALPEDQAQSREARQRKLRLTGVQGDKENWRQGEKAYRIGEWNDAVTYLQKVADSPHAQNQAEAEKLANRAQAALYAQEARQAEMDRAWGSAIQRYREASSLFEKYGSDPQTKSLRETCLDKLESLKSVEENDRHVRKVIAQAKSLVREAKQSAGERQSLLARVEPVPQFAQAVEMLLAVRQQNSTLTAELERALREAREAWRHTYLDGMEQASRSDDRDILRRAVERGEELREQQLLFEAKDKQLLQKLQEQLLDTEYERMLAGKTTDPALLEENRQRRWEIANPKTDDLYRQYQAAMERRVLLALSKEQSKETAFHYLKQEMRRPELYQSERLFQEFMHLCWETGNWQEAQRAADSLAYRAQMEQAQEKSRIWGGLIQAARLLDQGDKPGFEAELDGLQVIGQTHPNLNALLEEEREWLITWRLENLLREAQTASRSEDDQQLIQAAQWYAEAYALREADPRVRTGLENLGRKLNSSLEIYAEQAKKISIRKSLPESIRRAEKLLFILDSIQQVQDVLNLSPDTIEALADGRERVEAKLGPWRKVQAKLAQLDEAKGDYLSYPEPLRSAEDGGWRVGELDAQIAPLRQAARGDRKLMSLIDERQEEIAGLTEKADALNRQVFKLAQAIESESFSEVLQAAGDLEQLWRRYQPDGFAGLELLIRHRYPYTEKEVRRLREHRAETQRQQANLAEWESWADKAVKAYREVEAVGSHLNKDLDDLRLEKSLEELTKDCQVTLDKTAAFEEALDSEPDTDPISRKAAEAKSRIDPSWRGKALDNPDGYRERANDLLTQIEQDVEKIKQMLKQMKSAMRILEDHIRQHEESKNRRFGRKKPFPIKQLRNAEKRIKECQKIDPGRESVVQANKRLREIKQRYGVK